MFDKISGCARAGLTLALGWTVVGCGATGLAWVDQPESASGWSGPEERSAVHTHARLSATQAVIPAAANVEPTAAEPTSEGRPRLNHTITLGEVDVSPTAEQATAYGPSVSVTINNYGQAGAPAPGYGGIGYYYSGFAVARGNFNAARGSSSVIPAASVARSGASMQPGQNWPAVADHGSSFPYRSAPASPWR